LAQAQEPSFQSWLSSFEGEAAAEGLSPSLLRRVLPTLTFDPSVIEQDRKQPEGRMSFAHYAQRIVSPDRVRKGRQLRTRHASTLKKVSKQYGIPQGVIVALWGIESSFGTSPGSYRILDSLASLAYEGRRASFFRKELIEALKIVQEDHIAPAELEGSWAGAMGQCQFMPSTYRHYAVDFDGDGRRDIWDETGDVLASIARYLQSEGWNAGEKWGVEVKLTRPVPARLEGLDVRKPLTFWTQAGVKLRSGKPLPARGLSASLVQPDGPGGRSFLVYDNFRALMRWNHSTYFAASVGLLSDRIEGVQ